MNATDIIDKGLKAIDDSFESREEAETTRTERLRIDMTSKYILPQIIRPAMAVLFTIACFAIITVELVTLFFENPVVVSFDTKSWVFGVTGAIIGFYFRSRQLEKMSAQRNKAAMIMEKDKQQHEERMESQKFKIEIRREKQELLHKKRLKRKERRKS